MTKLNILLPSGKIIKKEEKYLDKIPIIMKFINDCKKDNPVLIDEYKFPIIEVDDINFTDIEIENINNFIFHYAEIYPSGEIELPPPENNFKIRHLHNLFEKKTSEYFMVLLYEKTLKQEINTLLGVMDLAIKLEMLILADKAAALIALKIKDKTIDEIQNIF